MLKGKGKPRRDRGCASFVFAVRVTVVFPQTASASTLALESLFHKNSGHSTEKPTTNCKINPFVVFVFLSQAPTSGRRRRTCVSERQREPYLLATGDVRSDRYQDYREYSLRGIGNGVGFARSYTAQGGCTVLDGVFHRCCRFVVFGPPGGTPLVLFGMYCELIDAN